MGPGLAEPRCLVSLQKQLPQLLAVRSNRLLQSRMRNQAPKRSKYTGLVICPPPQAGPTGPPWRPVTAAADNPFANPAAAFASKRGAVPTPAWPGVPPRRAQHTTARNCQWNLENNNLKVKCNKKRGKREWGGGVSSEWPLVVEARLEAARTMYLDSGHSISNGAV